uniref:Uncharacterized protein n=1 Tax=Arundo donax TaxID=35708 RepID=A0A0A9B9E4_ARUDO
MALLESGRSKVQNLDDSSNSSSQSSGPT